MPYFYGAWSKFKRNMFVFATISVYLAIWSDRNENNDRPPKFGAITLIRPDWARKIAHLLLVLNI